MNDLMIFKNPEFGEIRTVELDGEPWISDPQRGHGLQHAHTAIDGIGPV